jgi:hypothetical protein
VGVRGESLEEFKGLDFGGVKLEAKKRLAGGK